MLSSLVYIGEILNIDFIHTGACITECESSNPSIICYGGLLEPHIEQMRAMHPGKVSSPSYRSFSY